MVKDGYDDYGRYKSDNQLNNQIAYVLTENGEVEERKWQEVLTGDIVKIENDDSVVV